MSGSFNRMLDRLEGNYENEKQFTSDASHELRTPLSVIMAQAEILTEQLPEEDARRKSADTILRQSRQMSRLVSELLMISRMENHNLKLCEEDIDVRELMELVCEEMAEQAQEKTSDYSRLPAGYHFPGRPDHADENLCQPDRQRHPLR